MQSSLSLRSRFRRAFSGIALFLTTLVALSGCDPVPGGVMTTAQKEADLAWMFTMFETNYAPMALKSKKWGLDFEKAKRNALRRARATKTNEEFYAVMQEFVAEFHDAHTSLALTPSSLPGRSKIAFAGFLVERKGEDFVVREILPIVDKDALPVKVGDKILEVNGKSVKELVDSFVTKYRNLGNAESNYSLLSNMLFFRDSLKVPMPEEETLKLKIAPASKDGDFAPKVAQVEIPWSVRDYADFSVSMEAASKNEKLGEKGTKQVLRLKDARTGKSFTMAFTDQTGKVVSADRVLKQNVGAISGDGFRFLNPDQFTFDESAIKRKLVETPLERLKGERTIPKYANFVDGATFLPSYVYPSFVMKDGKPTSKKIYRGYIRIESFDPEPIITADGKVLFPDAKTIRDELRQTLATFQQFGVSEVFVDTLDNPGGSLELLLEVSQAFSPKKIDTLTMATRLNENWVSEMENGARNAKSPQREVYAKALKSMKESIAAGDVLSKPLPMDVIVPFQIQPNHDLKTPFKKVFVLVNEGNASCGDIFPAIMQDNKLATIVGRNTMGAGGNVVNYDQAPNSHATLRQTESLVVRKDGSYLENAGVKPEVEFDFNVDKKGVLSQAISTVEAKGISKYKTSTEFGAKAKPGDPDWDGPGSESKPNAECIRIMSAL
ncbi:MAG: hypothetical protein JST04_06190 [Bdellovibrionales bacterium]|nr:hypothetical protein [Bdellovibrionales bacterium]